MKRLVKRLASLLLTGSHPYRRMSSSKTWKTIVVLGHIPLEQTQRGMIRTRPFVGSELLCMESTCTLAESPFSKMPYNIPSTYSITIYYRPSRLPSTTGIPERGSSQISSCKCADPHVLPCNAHTADLPRDCLEHRPRGFFGGGGPHPRAVWAQAPRATAMSTPPAYNATRLSISFTTNLVGGGHDANAARAARRARWCMTLEGSSEGESMGMRDSVIYL